MQRKTPTVSKPATVTEQDNRFRKEFPVQIRALAHFFFGSCLQKIFIPLKYHFLMFKLLREFYLIKNFPNGYPFYKKIFANLSFIFSRLIVHRRENRLSFNDLFQANLRLRKGDIVLCGEQETVFSDIIGDVVNHAVIYVGRRRFVEAIGKGVGYVSFYQLFTQHNNLVILRTAKGTKRKIIHQAVRWAESKIGKPYDYEWSAKNEAFFCSKLVNQAYLAAGYPTKLRSMTAPRSLKRKIQTKITKAANALHPVRMVKGNFRVIFLSHNLELAGKRLRLKKSN